MNINKCNLCKHKSEVGIYNLQMCITCSDNPFVIDERFDAKEVEIIPEKAGELWGNENSCYMTTNRNSAAFIDVYGDNVSIGGVIHNKNGWTRLYPPVEDKNVERIEIEGVTWWDTIVGETKFNRMVPNLKGPGNYKTLKYLEDKPRMKMILEIPKD